MVSAVVALAAGGVRWWYDAQLANVQYQLKLTDRLRDEGVAIAWSYTGPRAFKAWRWLPRPLFWTPRYVYAEQAADDVLDKNAAAFAELQMQTMVILARQLAPHVQADAQGRRDPLIDVLRRHPTLKRLVVDASIRGTPAEFDAPIYTREDLALLERVLPNLKIEWIEVN